MTDTTFETMTVRAPSVHRIPMLLLGAWTLAATALVTSGVFESLPLTAFAAVVIVLTVGLTASYFMIPAVRRYAVSLGPYGLAWFHVWRIAAALIFLSYGTFEALPALFVALAGWGDLIAGVFAAALVLLARRRATVTLFHLVGLADFIVAVGTGLTLTLLAVPQMAAIATLPVALIPLVGVPISAATHIAALHMLAKGRAA